MSFLQVQSRRTERIIERIIKQGLKTILPSSLYEELKERRNEFILKRYAEKKGFNFSYPVNILELKMWCGFSREAVRDLETIKESNLKDPDIKSNAAIYLSRWYAFKGDLQHALENVRFAKQLLNQQTKLLVRIETELLMQLGFDHEAQNALKQYELQFGLDNDLKLVKANLLINQNIPLVDQERIGWINQIFHSENLAGIKKIDENERLNFFNITGESSVPPAMHGPKISVIMPAYNAAATIRTSIRSLLNQTWKNVEILVIDDCSTDNTFEIISEMSQLDPRIVPIQHDHNQGAYGARNTGLRHATGDYITVNDSDDWAHPQKLEFQINALLNDNKAIGSISKLVRVDERLYFRGSWRLGRELIRENTSSLLFNRKILDQIGRWDMVRSGSDSELINRIKVIFGSEALISILNQVPLAFCLDLNTNLTKKPDSHLRTIYFGKRNDYTESSIWWHKTASIKDLKLNSSYERRPFQIPESLLITPRHNRTYDLVVITDFSDVYQNYSYVYHLIRASVLQNKSVAIFNYPNYRKLKKYRNHLTFEAYELVNNQGVDRLTVGEKVTSEHIAFFNPRLLNFKIDEIPVINFNNLVIIVNDLQNDSVPHDNRPYQPSRILEHTQELFGQTGIWVATTHGVREQLLKNTCFPTPMEEIWTPFIVPGANIEKHDRFPTNVHQAPHLGCVAFSAAKDWLNTKSDLLNAYCARKPCKFFFLGEIERFSLLKRWRADNWIALPSKTITINQFLQDLDFYLYYPRKTEALPEFEAVLLALASGCIVIASPELEPDFGNALVYSTPAETWKTVETLWKDKAALQRQVEAGKAYIQQKCNPENILSRFDRITPLPSTQLEESN